MGFVSKNEKSLPLYLYDESYDKKNSVMAVDCN